jgi:hypothetical protein
VPEVTPTHRLSARSTCSKHRNRSGNFEVILVLVVGATRLVGRSANNAFSSVVLFNDPAGPSTEWAQEKMIPEIAKAIRRIDKGDDRYHSLRVALTRMHTTYKNAQGDIVKAASPRQPENSEACHQCCSSGKQRPRFSRALVFQGRHRRTPRSRDWRTDSSLPQVARTSLHGND